MNTDKNTSTNQFFANVVSILVVKVFKFEFGFIVIPVLFCVRITRCYPIAKHLYVRYSKAIRIYYFL